MPPARCAVPPRRGPARTRSPRPSAPTCRVTVRSRRRRRRAAILLDHPDRLIRRRHIGDIGDPHQHHLRRRRRTRRRLRLGDALEQHLPHPRQHPHRKLGGEVARAEPLGLAEGDVVGGRRHDLHPSDEVHELGQVGQHHDRIGADVVLRAVFVEGARDIATRQRFKEIDHPRAVGQPQHLPHFLGAHAACRMRDRLVEQRERVRAPSLRRPAR